MRIYSKIDIGKMRKSNQDAFFAGEISENTAIAVVCDGMGGANAGNIASETAVKSISEYILRSYRENMTDEDILCMIKNSVKSANIEIFDLAYSNTNLNGMGTTAVVTLVRKNSAVIAHVGDSRAYLINKIITQLTRDHSVVQNLIESGKITPEDAKMHPRKNVITRALGAEEDVVVDCEIIKLSQGDTLLLCTDGLTNFVDEAQMLEIFNNNGIDCVAEQLVKKANLYGGGDNITVVTVTP